MSDDSGNHPCYVAKGPCGHYYFAAVVDTRTTWGKELAAIRRRKGHVIELKTVQFVRDGGLDWNQDCREGKCGERVAERGAAGFSAVKQRIAGRIAGHGGLAARS